MNAAAVVSLWERCRLCRVRLGANDDRVRGVCDDCKERPEAKRLQVATNTQPPAAPASPRTAARPFTAPERALVRAMHGYVSADELLRILNERLVADLGAEAVPYTMEQLHREAQTVVPGAEEDWTDLRRRLRQAAATGTLAAITPAVVDDFALVFQLSVAQATRLHDVIAHARRPVDEK